MADDSTVSNERGREAVATNKKKARVLGGTSLEHVITGMVGRIESLEAATEQWEETKDLAFETDAKVTELQRIVEALREELALCRRALANGDGIGEVAPRVSQCQPKEFDGSRDARKVDDFIWQMEFYFDGIRLLDETAKVRTASSYLSDNAALWWRRKATEMDHGETHIDTWEDFKAEFKRSFYPKRAEFDARKKLKMLKCRTSIQDYIKEFTSLMLQIPDMQDKDFLFNFVDGLPQWAQNEIERREVETTQQAIAIAESLTEFNRNNHQPEKKIRKPHSGKCGGERDGKKSSQDKGNQGRHHARSSGEKKHHGPKFPRGCFLCGGPHHMRECPRAGSLNAICDEYESRDKQEADKMGSLQLLNALNVKPMPSKDKGLL